MTDVDNDVRCRSLPALRAAIASGVRQHRGQILCATGRPGCLKRLAGLPAIFKMIERNSHDTAVLWQDRRARGKFKDGATRWPLILAADYAWTCWRGPGGCQGPRAYRVTYGTGGRLYEADRRKLSGCPSTSKRLLCSLPERQFAFAARLWTGQRQNIDRHCWSQYDGTHIRLRGTSTRGKKKSEL